MASRQFAGGVLRQLPRFAPVAIYAAVTWHYISSKHFAIYQIKGDSMAPLLSPQYSETASKDWVVFKKGISHHELQRGMVVSFLSPYSAKLAVKRIVAIEGDTVKPLGRHNAGAVLWSEGDLSWETEDGIVIPYGHVWVEGDQVDREKNLDSNVYGPISKTLIQGIATRIVLPSARWGLIDWTKDWEKKCAGRIKRASQNYSAPAFWDVHD